ncbi:MAG: mechanosensitive ion channel family protein [bacterium]
MEKLLNAEWLTESVVKSFITHAPRVLIVIILCLVVIRIVRILTVRMERLVDDGDDSVTTAKEQRARTLSSIINNATRVIVALVGGMMVLQEIGFQVGPLIAGVGIFGLAVGFGAQNLVRDVVTGFFIILENQYGVGDVIKVCGIGGLVEDINLRVTTLRDIEGVVHYIPNGQIDAVSNMTKGWSRALVHVGVAYRENVDRVMEVLRGVCDEIKADPKFAPMLLDDFEIPGVEKLDDSSVVIRVMVKTQPLKQWDVMREMRRRFKNRLDEEGIEIPFPQRAVWMRSEAP